MNISLIGMMGSGKSTIGELLANQLNINFVDTDELIIKREKVSINEIFSTKGETYFREVEANILSNVLDNDNQVISTGGGIVTVEKNMELLKGKSITFYLKADDKTLYERVKNSNNRPLLNDVDILNKIKTLLSNREQMYNKADYVIKTDNKTPNEVVKEIIEKIV
ncbi:MAG: shikimate kinase [Cyanobacteria bacterium SIG29]|nr:shikimate kinase [Cyanobacteria bacterium SIG29]